MAPESVKPRISAHSTSQVMPKAKLSACQSSCPTETATIKSDAAAAVFEVHHPRHGEMQVLPAVLLGHSTGKRSTRAAVLDHEVAFGTRTALRGSNSTFG